MAVDGSVYHVVHCRGTLYHKAMWPYIWLDTIACVLRHLDQTQFLFQMKRALADDSVTIPGDEPPCGNPGDEDTEALRHFLISSYTLGKHVDGAFVAELCWHITKVGGKGVQDFAVNPKNGNASKNGNALIKHILARDFKDPDLVDVAAPFWNKTACHRDTSSVPMHLPSRIFTDQFEHTETPVQTTVEPKEVEDKYRCTAWLNHPVKTQSTRDWTRCIPGSLYWDAAQYTVRDNFFGMFIRNLRTGNQELIFIVSCILNRFGFALFSKSICN